MGQIIRQIDFEKSGDFDEWTTSPGAQLAPGSRGGKAMLVERKDNVPGPEFIYLTLPIEKWRGCKLDFSAQIKGENISKKILQWHGVRFGLVVTTADGEKDWPFAMYPAGSFDWKSGVFSYVVPESAVEGKLILGLESVTGKAWFDDIKISVRRPPYTLVAKSDPMNKGYDWPRLRGAFIIGMLTDEDLKVLGNEYGANLVRLGLMARSKDTGTGEKYDYNKAINNELAWLDKKLPLLKEMGMCVELELMAPPGGDSRGYNMFSGEVPFKSKKNQDELVKLWQRIAERYKNEPGIWGYGILNEPNDCKGIADGDDWQDLSTRIAQAIRAIDTRHAIMVEPGRGDDFRAISTLHPIDVQGIVYEIHMYVPHSITHQMIPEFPDNKWVTYPGDVNGKLWNKAALKDSLKPVIDFQKKYNVPIYVGEFSCIRWAPDNSAYRWLKDVIEIFEEEGWNWDYVAFRGWNGWSFEHSTSRDVALDGKLKGTVIPRPQSYSDSPGVNLVSPWGRSSTPTDRQLLFRDWFKKNQKVKYGN